MKNNKITLPLPKRIVTIIYVFIVLILPHIGEFYFSNYIDKIISEHQNIPHVLITFLFFAMFGIILGYVLKKYSARVILSSLFFGFTLFMLVIIILAFIVEPEVLTIFSVGESYKNIGIIISPIFFIILLFFINSFFTFALLFSSLITHYKLNKNATSKNNS